MNIKRNVTLALIMLCALSASPIWALNCNQTVNEIWNCTSTCHINVAVCDGPRSSYSCVLVGFVPCCGTGVYVGTYGGNGDRCASAPGCKVAKKNLLTKNTGRRGERDSQAK
jgi:hypothetical protein